MPKKYIIFSDSKVVLFSDSIDELLKYLDQDPTVYMMKVGQEDQNLSPTDDLLIIDRYILK
jgi:hypothetical protein